MKPKKSVELKPCPFCGGKAKLKGVEDHWVRCKGDNCLVYPETACYDTAREAIAAWNRRVKA